MSHIDNFLRHARSLLRTVQRITNGETNSATWSELAALDLIQGFQRLENAEALHTEFVAMYNESDVVLEAIIHEVGKADKLFARHQEILVLGARRRRSLLGWLEQATTFYTNALARWRILSVLTRLNISDDELLRGQALVEQVLGLSLVYRWESVPLRVAAQQRDDALDALDEWLDDLCSLLTRMTLPNALQKEFLQFKEMPILVY